MRQATGTVKNPKKAANASKIDILLPKSFACPNIPVSHLKVVDDHVLFVAVLEFDHKCRVVVWKKCFRQDSMDIDVTLTRSVL